jgi:hypothetical protein
MGHELIAWTVPAAAASVSEHDDPVGTEWNPKIPLQLDVPCPDGNQSVLEDVSQRVTLSR